MSVKFPPPLAAMHVTSPFGPRGAVRLPDGSTRPAGAHNGVDLRARTPLEVVSPVDGVVSKLTYAPSGAMQLFVEGEGYRFAFVHLSDILEAPGTKVVRGQPIAVTGDSGGVAPHLHLEARELASGQLVDPMTLFSNGGGGGGGLLALAAAVVAAKIGGLV